MLEHCRYCKNISNAKVFAERNNTTEIIMRGRYKFLYFKVYKQWRKICFNLQLCITDESAILCIEKNELFVAD
jgi:hypothetical protein